MRRAIAQTTVLMPALAGAVLLLSACGGSSSGGSPTGGSSTTPPPATAATTPAAAQTAPADAAAASAEVKTVWVTFFKSSTPPSQAKTLLEDGSSLGAALAKAVQEQKATGGSRSAVVKKVEFTSPTTANVTYRLHVGTTTLNSSGTAVLVDGHWKVSKVTFCSLVLLGNGERPVTGCA